MFEDNVAKIFEELSLNALYKSLYAGISINDVLLLIDEMPKILTLNYPVVKEICDVEIELIDLVIKNLMLSIRENADLRFWRLICRLQRSSDLLKVMLYPKS